MTFYVEQSDRPAFRLPSRFSTRPAFRLPSRFSTHGTRTNRTKTDRFNELFSRTRNPDLSLVSKPLA